MKVKYSKIEAAKSQLDLAIRLYFYDDDPASIHTLYGAAHKIVANLLNAKGQKSSLDEMVERVRPERKKEAYQLLHGVSNFLKHANFDGEKTLEFDSDLNELSLFIAARDYQALGGATTMSMALFRLWFMPRNAELFTPASDELQKLLCDLKVPLTNLDKKFFYNNVPIIAKERGIDLIGRSNDESD